MMKKVFSGHQPNFIPYMGVFYKIMKSDVFVLDDDVQYSNSGLHNANFLKISGERKKFVLPVSMKFGDAINEVKICRGKWIDKMLRSVKINYGRASHFDEGYALLEKYLLGDYEYLSDMNIDMIMEISGKFGFDTDFVIASKHLPTDLKNNDRNVYQCMKLGCNVYYSGTGGKEYNDEKMYADHGIEVVYSDFEAKEYKQLGGEFIPNLSVIDYIMNNGFILPSDWKKH